MLANFRQMLDAAQAGHYAVGAYDLINLEMLEGILDAAQESDTAVILQFAQVFEKAAGVDAADFGKAIVEAAKRATVPVAVHLDHGQDLEMVKKCVALGFNSVMIDASAKPFEENVRITKEVVDYCRPLGIPVEAELGHVGEGASYDLASYHYTDPALAAQFVEQTGVDALAVAIGNAHGAYASEPKINFAVLEAVRSAVSVPLVLHGASGIPDEDIRKTIAGGITKINIFTELTQQVAARIGELAPDHLDLFSVTKAIRTGTKERCLQKIRLFGTRR